MRATNKTKTNRGALDAHARPDSARVAWDAGYTMRAPRGGLERLSEADEDRYWVHSDELLRRELAERMRRCAEPKAVQGVLL
jgi:hypothetical protein